MTTKTHQRVFEVVGDKMNEIFGANNTQIKHVALIIAVVPDELRSPPAVSELIPASTVMMREVVVEVCRVVAERGARLAGAGIVANLKMIGRDKAKKRSVMAINGCLYEHYRLFRECLHGSAMEMLRWEDCPNSVIIDHLSGGSTMGAALVAAAHSNNNTPNSRALNMPVWVSFFDTESIFL
ncbi:hypothetical protein ACLOJK_036127 [Asimina triloba]